MKEKQTDRQIRWKGEAAEEHIERELRIMGRGEGMSVWEGRGV